MPITGKTLIEWGFTPGPGFSDLLYEANGMAMEGINFDTIRDTLRANEAMLRSMPAPVTQMPLRASGHGPTYSINMDDSELELERENFRAVCRHMDELMRLPTVVGGSVMPDACPAGNAKGTIPVGGVVVTKEAIHPGMHSADICCSMALSNLGKVDPKTVLNMGFIHTHFGIGERPRGRQSRMTPLLCALFEENRFLKTHLSLAQGQLATQGDGNHFFYVGTLASTGDTVIVTHHGSRGPGAKLYKAGMACAETYRRKLSPETPPHNAWIPSDTDDGIEYWEALQIIRRWTKQNHFAIHNRVIESVQGAQLVDRFWNEHNFVFRRDDGLFYHAKGATPAFSDFATDSSGLTLIPLNMAEPILIAKGLDALFGSGFAPHGAGRNSSRTAYMKTLAGRNPLEVLAEQAPGIDARAYSGVHDLSELPGAYKSAALVRAQIETYGLAEIVDTVQPYGCIMAGQQPWDRRKPKTRIEPVVKDERHWSEDLPEEDR